MRTYIKISYVFIVLVISTFPLLAQKSENDTTRTKWSEHTDFNGYLKYLHSTNFVTTEAMQTTNLLHNRFNFSAHTKKWTLKIGMRNRVFYGDQVVFTPNFAEMLELDNGLADLTFSWYRSNTVIAHTTFDRAYINWADSKREISLGRQRINWGMNLAWNANDLFNTYNFVDFDYEERPGNDAIRYQHYLQGGMAVLDAAIKPGKELNESVTALRYQFNTHAYDIQLLGGWYYSDYAIGLGWAGNLYTLGFKGESTLFIPREQDTVTVLSSSVSLDYSFDNGTYINASVLYNSNGISKNTANINPLLFNNITAKNLMPTRWSGFVQCMYNISPLVNSSLSVIYGSGIHLLFLMPSLAYSINTNWDISLVGQLYFLHNSLKYTNAGNSIFLRVKWSF